jgi:hypothetical protein
MSFNLIGALVFSLAFFATWSLKDACNAGSAPAAIKPLLICIGFVLLAFVITKVL